MIVTTTSDIQGHDIAEYKGIVKGLVVLTPTLGQSVNATFKSLLGGQIKPFTDMCVAARQDAYENMLNEAKELGADAVIGMTYDSSEMVFGSNSAIEILCYGTAVVFETPGEPSETVFDSREDKSSVIIDKEV